MRLMRSASERCEEKLVGSVTPLRKITNWFTFPNMKSRRTPGLLVIDIQFGGPKNRPFWIRWAQAPTLS